MGYIYMLGALGCWTAVSFVYRSAERRRANRFFMLATMGIAATVIVLLYTFAGEIDLRETHVSQVVVGCSIGLTALVGIPLFLAAVARGDLSITWTVLTLSFGLASLLAIIYPGERPTARGVTGLALAAAAVALLGLDMAVRHRSNSPAKPRKGWGLFISLAFVFNAFTLYAFKLGAHFQPDRNMVHSLGLLLSAYVVFAAGGLLLAFLVRRPGSVRAGLLTGAAAGTLLVNGGLLTLLALAAEKVPAHVLYPATNGGSSILVVLLSVLLLKERPGPYGWMGIAAGTTALVLLSLAV